MGLVKDLLLMVCHVGKNGIGGCCGMDCVLVE